MENLSFGDEFPDKRVEDVNLRCSHYSVRVLRILVQREVFARSLNAVNVLPSLINGSNGFCISGHWRMFVSKASRYAFRISHNVYFDNQLKTGKDRVVSSSAFALSTVGILLSAFGLRQMGHNQKWIERG